MRKFKQFFVILLLLPGIYGFTYTGDGEFSELTRTYVPVIGVTKGFTIELPIFVTSTDIKKTYYLGSLPEQTETLHIDLVTAIPEHPPSPEEEKRLLNQMPKDHNVKCILLDSSNKRTIASMDLNVFDIPRMQNRKLRREFILNLIELKPKTITKDTELEIRFEYQINGKPLDHEMLLIVLMDAPFA